METTIEKLQRVYTTLDEILVSPQVFGVRQNLPQPLADSLRALRETLGQALRDLQFEGPSGDLAAELSQNAGRLSRAEQ